MQIIKTFKEVEELPLEPSLATLLQQELTTPFNGNKQEADQFWIETNTTLLHISELDNPQILLDKHPALKSALTYPEFETELIPSWCLVLSIINSQGTGLYVLAPKTILASLKEALTK